MEQVTFTRVPLQDTGGAEVLLKRSTRKGEYEAAGYSRAPHSPFTNLPAGHYEEPGLYEKYLAWAYHAEQVRFDIVEFEHAAQQMAAISVKYGK